MNIMPKIFEELNIEPFEYVFLRDQNGKLLDGKFSLSDNGDIIHMGEHLLGERADVIFRKILTGEYEVVRDSFEDDEDEYEEEELVQVKCKKKKKAKKNLLEKILKAIYKDGKFYFDENNTLYVQSGDDRYSPMDDDTIYVLHIVGKTLLAGRPIEVSIKMGEVTEME